MKDNLLVLFLSLLFVALGLFLLLQGEHVWLAWVTIVFFGIGIPVAVFNMVTGRSSSGVQNIGWPEVEIGDHELIFSRYPFKYSAVSESGARIDAEQIDEVFFSISDVAFVLDCKEVIFLPKELKTKFDEFTERNGIKTAETEEVWMILAHPYIDQPYEQADEIRDYERLRALGFGKSEVRQIRQKVRETMLWATVYSMEWGFYTTQDVLRAFALLGSRQFTEKFYWWVMEIALRNYCSGSRQPPIGEP